MAIDTKTLEEHAQEWDDLAAAEIRSLKWDHTSPEVARNRADLYRRTAEAIRMEDRTGIAVCACCFKPYAAAERFGSLKGKHDGDLYRNA